RQHQELGAGTNRVPEPGAGSGTAANIKGSVTRSRDNYLENRRVRQVLHAVRQVTCYLSLAHSNNGRVRVYGRWSNRQLNSR
ncbi:MAG: hypothetical protein ACLGID_08270, partial [Gammaproteobacteria bacterium]